MHDAYIAEGKECIACHPMEVVNLCGAPPSPAVIAHIATILETWGRVTVVNSAIAMHPGQAAFALGQQYEKAEQERANAR